MRKTFAIALSVAIAVVLVNDLSRLVSTHLALDNVATIAVYEAVGVARGNMADVERGYEAAQSFAESEGANVYGYLQEDEIVKVWVEAPVEGTILIAPIFSLWSGGSWTDPLFIRKEAHRNL